MAIPDKFNGNNFGLSPVAQQVNFLFHDDALIGETDIVSYQISTMISDFVDNHGTTVVVSASVFCILHMITLVLNKDKNADTKNGVSTFVDWRMSFAVINVIISFCLFLISAATAMGYLEGNELYCVLYIRR